MSLSDSVEKRLKKQKCITSNGFKKNSEPQGDKTEKQKIIKSSGHLTDDEIAACKEAFILFDMNADGYLDPEEFTKVLRSLSRTPSDSQVEKMMKDVIHRKDGNVNGIQLDDFIAQIASILPNRDSEDKIREAFQIFDKKGDGRLLEAELRQSLTTGGDCLTDEEVDQLIQGGNVDINGMVEIESLVRQICDMHLGIENVECNVKDVLSDDDEDDSDY